MKKLSLIICSVAILCIINVTNIRAEGTVNQTNSTYTAPNPIEQPAEEESTIKVLVDTIYEGCEQKANQFYQLLLTVLKGTKEMQIATTRNML